MFSGVHACLLHWHSDQQYTQLAMVFSVCLLFGRNAWSVVVEETKICITDPGKITQSDIATTATFQMPTLRIKTSMQQWKATEVTRQPLTMTPISLRKLQEQKTTEMGLTVYPDPKCTLGRNEIKSNT